MDERLMKTHRRIIHVDMDAFYASVEELRRPELAGQPVIVGGRAPRGVVSAASYEARKYGVTSAMPMAVAERLCPKGVFLPVDMPHYVGVSGRIREIFRQYTPVVEPMSLDEAYLDVTGSARLFGEAPAIGRKIKTRIRTELGLPASVGVAPNKFLAKLASDIDKPDGFVALVEEDAEAFLAALPVERIPGVGKVGVSILHELGVTTIRELHGVSIEVLLNRFGAFGYTLENLARGRDDSPVVPDADAKSIGNETTFAQDVDDIQVIAEVVRDLAANVGRRLREARLKARRVNVKVRFADFKTSTRSRTLAEPTHSDRALIETARALLDERLEQDPRQVRLVGVTTARLVKTDFEQLGLFADPGKEKDASLDRAVDRIRQRFGRDAIHRG